MLAAGSLPSYALAQSAASAPSPEQAQVPPQTAEEGAQPASGDGVDSGDIVVTANRRVQSLQDVGISMAAFSGETLKQQGLNAATDLAQLTPGVSVSGSVAGQSQQFTVRGVTQSDFSDAVESPVATYIDDVYIPTQQGQTLALFDVQRVEVLKGPQGTLFGRNATGGLINTIINLPETDRVAGDASVSYGSFNEVRGEASLNVPLSSRAALRVSGFYNRIDNFWRNRYPAGAINGAPLNFGPPNARPTPCCGNEGGGRTFAGRAQLLVEPTERLKVRLVASAADQNLSTAAYTSSATIGTYDAQGRLIQADRVSPTETRIAIGPDDQNYTNYTVIPFAAFSFPGGGRRAPGATWFGYVPLDPESLELSSDYARRRLNTTSVKTVAGHVDWDLGGDVSLASITAYQHYNKEFLMDADGSPTNIFVFGTKAKTDAFSQEVRLSGGRAGFRWTAGVYYLDNLTKATQGLIGPSGSLLAAAFGLQATGVELDAISRLHTQSLSGFGQAEVGLAPKWTLVMGGRIISEHQKYNLSQIAALNTDDYKVEGQTALFPFRAPFQDSRTKTLWVGKAQIEYRPAARTLLYAGVNRGVKGGSYNAPLPGGQPITDSQVPYGAETLTNYEAGVKWGDRLFSANMSTYYYDYRNYQAFLYVDASGYVQNVKDRTYGIDADAALQATDTLRLTVGASYSHAVIPDFEIAPGVTRDVRPTYAPRKQLTGAANYRVPTNVLGGELGFNAAVNYSSGFYHNLRNFNADWFNRRTLVNLSANWKMDNGFTVNVFANNVFDKRYGLIGFDNTQNCGCNDESFGKPRSIGAALIYRF